MMMSQGKNACGMHHDHMGHASAHGHHHDHGAMVKDFKRRFWICGLITLPVLALSPMIQMFLGVGEAWRFAGDTYTNSATS
jgi:Cu2+-exporting ATPase